MFSSSGRMRQLQVSMGAAQSSESVIKKSLGTGCAFAVCAR